MLWTYFELDVDKHDTHITDRQRVFKTGLYLGRSRERSLSVVLYGDMTDHAIIPTLEISIPRWEYLATALPLYALRSFSGNVFSRLSALEISYHSDPDVITTEVDTFTSISAPALRTVYTLDGEWRIFDDVQIPWSQLTEVNEFPAFDIPAIHRLRKCSDLEEIEINITPGDYTAINHSISLPKVRALTMTEIGEVELGRSKEFLDHLNAPSLASLTLSYPAHPRHIHFPETLRLVKTGEKLTKLDLCCAMNAPAANTQSLLAFLSLLPNAEHFRLRDPDVPAEFFTGLNRSSSSRLPRLRILDISDCSYAAQCIDLIFDLLESRCDRQATESGNDAMVHDAFDRRQIACLETAVVPRPLYSQPGERWEVIRRALEVQCGG